MGNKASRSKSMSDADAHDVRRRNRKNANMEAQNGGRDGGDNKHISCPDLGGAVPYKFHEDPGPDIKIHRSYANLDQSRGAPEPDIKIYRRSTGGVPKYATLPRSFGRSKSSAAGVVNGNVREFPDVGNRRSPSSEGVFRLSKRTSAASSVNSLATAPVSAGDFPDTAEVKRKLSLFEDAFARYLADKFSRLGDVIQLSLVALAVERGADGDPPGRVVTLHDYLATESVPADLLGAEYLLPVIPESLLHGIQHVRADKVSDLDLWLGFLRVMQMDSSSVLVVSVGVLLGLYYIYNKMPKVGSPLFRIGYCLYTQTRLGYIYYRKDVDKSKAKYKTEGHSFVEPTLCNGMRILPIAMALDNYGYLITDERSNVSVLVDPADYEAVFRVLDAEGIAPVAVLTTHKHWDHSGGNRAMRRRFSGIRVFGGKDDHVPDCTHQVTNEEILEFGSLRFTARFTPGHTTGHVVYVLDGTPFGAPQSVFSGDHLFLSGIGRMFEGSSRDMLLSLDKLAELPNDTLLWPGHEYAKDNLEFAAQIDSGNEAIANKYEWVKSKRLERKCTSPSTIGEEKTYNPFLRIHTNSVLSSLSLDQTKDLEYDQLRAKALLECRKRKDKFKYKL